MTNDKLGVRRGILVDVVDVVDVVMADVGTRVPVFVICHLSFVMRFAWFNL